MTVSFANVRADGRDVLRLALAAAGLPADDLDGPNRMFMRMSDGAGPIGYVGLEGNGPDRLLRSLVVLPSRRGQGHGRRLVELAEAMAGAPVRRLHLLTTDAAPFFRQLGYADADRATAPAAISESAQFKSICPASASYLTKDLT